MVVVNYEGEFLNVKTCEDSGIYEVKSEGSYVEVEFKGQKKKILNIKVENSGKEMIWSPTISQGRTAVKSWSNETSTWVGKKFQAFKIQDQMIIKPL